jgi:hypothetical protein
MDRTLTYDSTASFRFEETEGVTVDGEEVRIDWSDVETVTVSDAPWTDAFDTEEFYKIEGVLTKPVKQLYRKDGSVEAYTKPAEEIEKAAWSADNIPFTLDHPATGTVQRPWQVHGFWRNPRFDSETNELRESLYIPTNDEEAKGFVEDANDVSIGFFSDLESDFDGAVGDVDTEDLDGYQTNLMIDHAAAVDTGRCSGDQGCGLAVDSAEGETFKKQYRNAYGVDVESGDVALNADERAAGLTLDDVQGADDSELESEDAGGDTDDEQHEPTETTDMTDNDFDLDTGDLTLDTIAEMNDEVAELVADHEQLQDDYEDLEEDHAEAQDRATAFEDLRESLDIEEDHDPEDVIDAAEARLDATEDLEDELAEYREDEREDLISEIEQVTDRYEDEYEDMNLDELEAKRDELHELAQDIGADVSIKGGVVEDSEGTTDEASEEGVVRVRAWEENEELL